MSFARRSLQVTAFVLTLLIGAVSLGVIVTQTAWFRDWLRGFIVRQADEYLTGELSIGRLHGNLFFGLGLEDVEVRMDGRPVIGVREVGLDYSALTFARGDLVLNELRLEHPVIHLERRPDGWNITQLVEVRTPDPEAPPRARPIRIDEIAVAGGTVHIEDDPEINGIEVPQRIENVEVSVGVTSDEDALVIDIGHVSLRAHEPSLQIHELSGRITRTEDEVVLDEVTLRTGESALRVAGTIGGIDNDVPVVDLRASSERLVLEEIARIIPALRGYELQPAFEMTASGPVDGMAVSLDVSDPAAGHIVGNLTIDALDPARRLRGDVEVERLDVGVLLPRRDAPPAEPATLTSNITGRATIDLELPGEARPLRGTYAITASQVQVAGYEVRNVTADGRIDGDALRISNATADAYGGRATAAGLVQLVDPLQLDLTGRAANVDLRNLPPALEAPGVPSNLQFSYALRGRGNVFSGELRMQPSMMAGATIADGTRAEFRVGDGAPAYSAQGEIGNLDLHELGRGFGIEALGDERYRSSLNATFDVTGRGGGDHPLALDASLTMVDSRMFDASFPQFAVTAHVEGDDIQVQAVGRFAGLNPEALTGNERLAGEVTGAVDIDASIRGYRDIAPDDLAASGRVDLERSTVAGLTIDSASVAGAYTAGMGEVEELTITSPDLRVQGQGAISLSEVGDSNFTFHAEATALEEIGALIDQPLEGGAIIDATVTGNARELIVQGDLQGNDIGYANMDALSLKSDFRVTLPNLTMEDATIQANISATFLEIAGQAITELTAEVSYAQPRLQFAFEAQEDVRELTAGGSAIFHPDRQEIQLTALGLRAEAVNWEIAPGTEATIDYRADRIGVDGLELVSRDDQRIEVDGVFGAPDEALHVTIEHVDVAEFDRLLLGDERAAGRLTAEAVVSGTREEPRVDAEFRLAPGAFEEFTFEAFSGSVEYGGPGVTVDVRLDQAPEHWITVTGYAPMSLFRPTPAEAAPAEAPAAAEVVDLTVASSVIDLGVIQGFTDAVTNVTGALQANIQVTGTGDTPRFDGTIDITAGAFDVPALGTAYTGIDTRIELQQDVLSIEEMQIRDARENLLTVGGTLAVHGGALGAFDVTASARRFQVIDNEMADISVGTNLRLSGELRAPRIQGFIEVDAGTVNVSEVVAQVTRSPLDLPAEPIDPFAPPPPPPDAAIVEPTEPGEEPSFFDAVDLDVGIAIPGNLLLRGTGIRPVGAPVAIGDMNVTVGGAIQIRKPPREALRLNGEVNMVRGTYTFQGRRFDIMRDGRIQFLGAEELDPLLDIRARRIISGVETFIRVQGTLRQPELTFSSNPPLDEADILSLIVFNMPLNELGEGQQVSLAERAGALATGYLAAGLTRSIGRVIGLDEFEIQARGEAGEGPRVIIGERIGDNLFVRIEHGFGAEQATELNLEYQIAEFLRLTGSIAETPGGVQRVQFRRVERGGIDLIFFFSY